MIFQYTTFLLARTKYQDKITQQETKQLVIKAKVLWYCLSN